MLPCQCFFSSPFCVCVVSIILKLTSINVPTVGVQGGFELKCDQETCSYHFHVQRYLHPNQHKQKRKDECLTPS